MSRASSSSSRNLTSVSFLVLALFVMLLILTVKVYSVFFRTPGKVRAALDDTCSRIDDDAPPVEQKGQFLDHWEVRCQSLSCPSAITNCDSSFFEGDGFVVVYTDSLELPGLPVYSRQFRIWRSLTDPEEGR